MPPAQLESRRDVSSQLANDALARPQILSKDHHIWKHPPHSSLNGSTTLRSSADVALELHCSLLTRLEDSHVGGDNMPVVRM
jgi:hypothetical protein